MLLPTHLAAGLIIGKLTGDYTVAFIGSVAVDLDHFFAFYKSHVLLKVKKIILATTSQDFIVNNQRNYFHNIFCFLAVAVIMLAVNFKVGAIFSLAYLVHLIFDALDDQEYYPFYPNKKLKFRGPIKYFSKQEIIFALALFLIFLLV
ncbi:MAG: metal-dependent hydrolase [Patescibacteria group bacterium]|nr:metal-dependent hydrolase [Patescibacteria group bacterium]